MKQQFRLNLKVGVFLLKMVYVCKAKNGEEIDGWEEHPKSIKQLLILLAIYKEAHIQTEDEKINLWVKAK